MPVFTAITGERKSGKTTVAKALRSSIGHQTGAKVLLVDEDNCAPSEILCRQMQNSDFVILIGEKVDLVKDFWESIQRATPFPAIRHIDLTGNMTLGCE